MAHKAKAHVVLPVDLLETIDNLVGKRRRSRFIAEAAAEKIARERFARAVEEAAGAWGDYNHPEMKDREAVDRYVREIRNSYLERISRLHHE